MKMFAFLAMVALSSITASAAPYTHVFFDPYGGSSPGSAGTNGDVIGGLRRFDIENLTIDGDGGAFTITIFMNYGQDGGDTSLGGITVSPFPTLYPGDVLFTIGASRYAIPLISHNNSGPGGAGAMAAGNLYLVNSYLTALTVLNNPPSTAYRPDAAVWGNATGATNRGSGSVNAILAAGVELQITLSVNTSDAAFINALENGPFNVSFASATCGNDLVGGDVLADPIPEPMTFLLIGSGLVALALKRRAA